jgi:hypothetical protein
MHAVYRSSGPANRGLVAATKAHIRLPAASAWWLVVHACVSAFAVGASPGRLGTFSCSASSSGSNGLPRHVGTCIQYGAFGQIMRVLPPLLSMYAVMVLPRGGPSTIMHDGYQHPHASRGLAARSGKHGCRRRRVTRRASVDPESFPKFGIQKGKKKMQNKYWYMQIGNAVRRTPNH